jgi:hypothetical protein
VEVHRATHQTQVEPAPIDTPRREFRPAPALAEAPRPRAVLQPEARVTSPAQIVRARAEAPAAHALGPAAGPVVHFSIGRLEVRAPAPPPEKRAAGRAAGPRLSLEAYLDSRRGGGR